MDAPVRQDSIPGILARDADLPELVDSISPTDTSSPRTPRSLRTRPSDLLLRQHASPPAPLRDPSRPADASSRASKMSLFNLFSKPKVERLRGYREPGVEARTPSISTTRSSRKQDDVLLRVQDACCEPPRSRSQPPRAHSMKSATSFRSASPIPPMPPPYTRSQSHLPMPGSVKESRAPTFDLLPLFQAYPQATKYGTIEVTPLTPEMIIQMSEARRPSGDALARTYSVDESKSGVESKTRVKAPSFIRHAAQASISKIELHRKLFVLVTSGYLLQYAEEGPHDRLPEKVLHLGQESAAFACDLITGKHHVLQILQAVDEKGVMIAPSASFFAKIGIRSQHSRRIAASFLLVLPGPMEMDSWLTAIRKEIEVQGGRRPDSPEKIAPSDATTPVELPTSGLTKTPSHRYQVKRDPAKVTSLASPSSEVPDPLRSPPIVKIDGNDMPDDDDVPATAHETEPTVDAQKNNNDNDTDGKGIRTSDPENDDDETATLDGIEHEASQILPDDDEATRDRAPSDAPSAGSSTALSVEQQSLDRLRSSMRASHSSTAHTSRASSLTSSPPALSEPSTTSPDLATSETMQTKKPFRTVSAYGLNRRSMINAPPPLEQAPTWGGSNTEGGVTTGRPGLTLDTIMDSPTVGHHHPGLLGPSPPKRLALAQSSPNLRSQAAGSEKHDAQIPPPPIVVSPHSRRQSVIADLPSLTNGPRSNNPHRASMIHPSKRAFSPTSPDRQVQTLSHFEQPKKPGRYYAQPAAIPATAPLPDSKVFPGASVAIAQTVQAVQAVRTVSNTQANRVLSPVPAVHTLTAKVDYASRTTIGANVIPPRKSSTPSPPRGSPDSAGPSASESRVDAPPSVTPTAHLALFPSPPLAQESALRPVGPSIGRAMSHSNPHPLSHYGQPSTVAPGQPLRRPTSLMIKSDHAPFLSSVRNSTIAASSTAVPFRMGTTAPIRSLKPSRNSIIMQSAGTGRDSPTSLPSPTAPGMIPLTPPRPASRTTMSSSPSPPPYISAHHYINPVSETLASGSASPSDEASDVATPLPSASPPPTTTYFPGHQSRLSIDLSVPQPPSQPPSRPNSRQTYHRSSRKPSRSTLNSGSISGLPELDFGIPIIGLGPPAPPPQAPLPDLPPAPSSSARRPMSPPALFRLPQPLPVRGINGVLSGNNTARATPESPKRAARSPSRHIGSPSHNASSSGSSTSSSISSTSELSSELSFQDEPTLPALSPQASHTSSIARTTSGLGIIAA